MYSNVSCDKVRPSIVFMRQMIMQSVAYVKDRVV
jgi:hypothetical protein